ncbi:maleylpyruvate isomerase N-terminal domain-containing protein [Aquihabitans sp. McL0605]|uniref:maleylpyruvate isomerase N-terminal domain-containing protein n=1 Tax=Aquihabitans sp. McL0605 TaxID=3415671 RepID=UPI003CF17636
MQLTPRYGSRPVLALDGDPAAIAGPTIRQRQRLADAVGGFTAEQWAHPTRCRGWSSRDVISHLDSTNAFWTFAIGQGLQGQPSQLLATFDPVATPAQLVAATEADTDEAVRDRFLASNDAFLALLDGLDAAGWTTLAEAPPGHLTISALAHHALWDGWVHERDILLPQGTTPAVEADEVAASLRYVAGMAPAYALTRGETRRGTLAIEATDPDVHVVVDVGDEVDVRSGVGGAETDLRVTGSAVDLLEALSIRAPLPAADPASASWLLDGLAVTFDGEPT